MILKSGFSAFADLLLLGKSLGSFRGQHFFQVLYIIDAEKVFRVTQPVQGGRDDKKVLTVFPEKGAAFFVFPLELFRRSIFLLEGLQNRRTAGGRRKF